jgi:pimeloyl-ACP methyl ester carboxylesterase
MPKVPPSRRRSAGRPPRAALAGAGAPGSPRVRRGYFECRYGQLHVHNAIPWGGGFEEGTPLLCLHPSPLSARVFKRFLAVAGARRSIFAPDLPGFGDSDPPSGVGLGEHAAAIGDFLDAMRLRQIDLLGHGFGALVAVELATARPGQIRRMVLVSPPASAQGSPRIQPALPVEATVPRHPGAAMDGSYLLEEWRHALAYGGPDATPEIVNAAMAERLRNAAQTAAVAAAARDYPLHARLAQLSVPLLVLRLGSEVGDSRDVPARARLIELPERAASLFETAPDVAAQALEAFLR